MPKFIRDITQGSDQWARLRMGKATASNFDRILSEKTGKYSETSATKYAREVAIQRLLVEETERPLDGLYWVERGKALEPQAAQHYEKIRGRTLTEIGLIISDDDTVSCSPDRLALISNDDWTGDPATLEENSYLCGVEIKAPSTETHLAYWKAFKKGDPIYDYRWQILGSLHVSEFPEWDFCSFNPRLTELIIPHRREFYTDELKLLASALSRFEEEVQQYCATMREIGYVELIGQAEQLPTSEWQKMLEADPGLWALG